MYYLKKKIVSIMSFLLTKANVCSFQTNVKKDFKNEI